MHERPSAYAASMHGPVTDIISSTCNWQVTQEDNKTTSVKIIPSCLVCGTDPTAHSYQMMPSHLRLVCQMSLETSTRIPLLGIKNYAKNKINIRTWKFCKGEAVVRLLSGCAELECGGSGVLCCNQNGKNTALQMTCSLGSLVASAVANVPEDLHSLVFKNTCNLCGAMSGVARNKQAHTRSLREVTHDNPHCIFVCADNSYFFNKLLPLCLGQLLFRWL